MRRTTLMLGAALLLLGACNRPNQSAQDNAAVNAAMATAAKPSAGTISAATSNATDPGGPPVTLSEAIEAGSDEAPQQLRDKVASASRIVSANSTEATPGQ